MGKKLTYSLTALLIIILNLIFIPPKKSPQHKINLQNPTPVITISLKIASTSSAQLATVKKVIDGDTIELTSGQKVRYIGINTPELHHPQKTKQCFGEEAKNINRQLVEGKTVRLEKDVSETDQYQRLLRYVFLPDQKQISSTSGLFINQYLVEEGYAYATTFPPDVKYASLFRQKQEEARLNNKGLWKNCPL
jgi:micrococcal nuclease